MGQTIVIVIPCYNEESRLQPAVFEAFSATGSDVRFLFVDDGSSDDTLTVLKSIQENASNCLPVLRLPENRGKGEAVRRGVLKALEIEPEIVGFWDADLATPLEEIHVFAERMMAQPDLEVVLGSRVRLLGHEIERDPLRHYMGRVAATVVSRMLRLSVYDTQCGAKIFRNTPHLGPMFGTTFCTRWLFDVEILARWLGQFGDRRADRDKILEIPVQKWTDVSGSRLTLRDFFRVPLDLLRIYRHYRLYDQ